jgi:hypothetical protein
MFQNATQRAHLLDTTLRILAADSPIGPRNAPGCTGYVWPAIAQLLTWAATESDEPGIAWSLFTSQLYATHMRAFPDKWMGIWGGPDGFVSTCADPQHAHVDPGNTWCSPVTPEIDVPVGNSNPEAMFILALVRLSGVSPDPSGIGLVANCSRVAAGFRLQTPLFSLQCLSGGGAHVVRRHALCTPHWTIICPHVHSSHRQAVLNVDLIEDCSGP